MRAELARGDAADDAREIPAWWLPAGLFGVIAVLMVVDVAGEARAGAAGAHVLFELAVAALALAGVGALGLQVHRARRRARVLGADLARVRADASRWREESLQAARGLGEAMDRQFDRWKLTAAEREVGLLLLKGLSLREIAQARGTAERTVRQQSLALYRKAGLGGRSELAAFFLEDLLAPPAPPAP